MRASERRARTMRPIRQARLRRQLERRAFAGSTRYEVSGNEVFGTLVRKLPDRRRAEARNEVSP